jgi:hypothetical protein
MENGIEKMVLLRSWYYENENIKSEDYYFSGKKINKDKYPKH